MNTPHRDCLSGLFFVKLDVLRALFQTISPGKDEESNWLPAPNGPFSLYIRAYWSDKASSTARGNRLSSLVWSSNNYTIPRFDLPAQERLLSKISKRKDPQFHVW